MSEAYPSQQPTGTLQRRLSVVCHQVQAAANLGAVARVMANFGFQHLVLSNPHTHDFRTAEKLAVGAEALLDHLRLTGGLAEAVGDAVYAVGTSSRRALKRRVPLSPEEAVARLAEAAARGPVALVFGGEKRGLSDEELAVCQDVVAIPTSEAQPSMNLSHSVAVMLYLAARFDAREAAPRPEPVPAEATAVRREVSGSRGEAADADSGAPLKMHQVLQEGLGEVLSAAGFLNPQAPEHALRELLGPLHRAGLSRREAEMWLSAVRHLVRACRRG